MYAADPAIEIPVLLASDRQRWTVLVHLSLREARTYVVLCEPTA